MVSLDYRTPGGAVFWTIGMIVVGIVFRLGWEIGGKVWMIL